MDNLLSIIIPIFNLSKYLPTCLDSIFLQSFINYEILLVDDGSSDESWRLCTEYEKKYCRVRAFHKKNGGVSSARNLGMKEAQGEWVIFIDGDDIISIDGLSAISKELSNNDTDLLVYGQRRYLDGHAFYDVVPQQINPTPLEFISSSDYNHSGCVYVFRKEWIDKYNIKFCEDITHSEDQNFILKYLSHNPRIKCIKNIIYHYLFREKSASNKEITLNCAECNLKAASDFASYCYKNVDVSKEFIYWALCSLYEQYIMYIQMVSQFKSLKIQKFYRENWIIASKCNSLFKYEKRFLLCCISIRLYLCLKNLKDNVNCFKKSIRKL